MPKTDAEDKDSMLPGSHPHRGSGIWIRILVVVTVASLAACAKTGEPQPPLVMIPRPATDLGAAQVSDHVVLTVSPPAENTTGSPVTTLDRVELLRAVTPDRSDSKSLPEEDFLKLAVAVFTVPALGLPSFSRNGRLTFEDDLSIPNRPSIYRQAFRYAVRFINTRNQTAGLSNQVFVAPVAIPPPPAAPSFEVKQDQVRLTWTPPLENVDGSQPPRIVGYNVYRAEAADRFGAAPLNEKPLEQPEFQDRGFQFDKTYYYAVSIVGNRAEPYAETLASPPATVTPRDTFPPGPPANLNVVPEAGVLILLWSAPPDDDVAGYRIYRRSEASPAGVLLEPELIRELSYRDQKVQSGTTYTYSVRAVDVHGNEGPAAESTTTP
jgi:hypothetical protein